MEATGIFGNLKRLSELLPSATIRRLHSAANWKSDHFDGRRFVNPNGVGGQPLSAVARMLMQSRTRWPARIDEPAQRPIELNGAAAVVTFIGHATFLIQTPAGNILTDPMYS